MAKLKMIPRYDCTIELVLSLEEAEALASLSDGYGIDHFIKIMEKHAGRRITDHEKGLRSLLETVSKLVYPIKNRHEQLMRIIYDSEIVRR